MLGKPKYTYGDVVKFKCGDEIITGIVAIIDGWGTFEDNSDVSYDLMCKERNIFYKHFSERNIIEKIGQVPEEEIWNDR